MCLCICHFDERHKKPIYIFMLRSQPANRFPCALWQAMREINIISNGMLWLPFFLSRIFFEPPVSKRNSIALICLAFYVQIVYVQINARCDWCYFIMNHNYGTLSNRLHYGKNCSLIFLAFSSPLIISAAFTLPWAWLNWISYFNLIRFQWKTRKN